MKRNLKKLLIIATVCFALISCSKNEYESDGVLSPVISITKVKAMHNGDDVLLIKEKLDGAYQITGVVISDKDNGNTAPNEIVVQNYRGGTTAGLVFSFEDHNTNFNMGDSVKIDINNGLLTRKNGTLKILGSDFNFSRVTKISSGNIVIPQVLTPTQLYSGFFNYESILVQIDNVSFDDVSNGQTYEGSVKLFDESGSNVLLSTSSSASFAQQALPLTASIVGIPAYYDANSDYFNRAKTLLKMRNSADAFNESGSVYLNFPETFESVPAALKSDYIMPVTNDKVTFSSGTWRIYQGVIGDRLNFDRFNPLNGVQAIRLQQKLTGSAYLEMDFDLKQGASKVTIAHAIYGQYSTNPRTASAWDLEYSQDQGATWTKSGETVEETNTKNATLVTFNINIKGNVRFRINKLGSIAYPNGQNGMLNIDDFTVYQNVD